MKVLSALLALGALPIVWLSFAGGDDAPTTARPSDARSAGIGRRVPPITLPNLAGKATLLPEAAATVVALTSTTCPLCKKYGPSLARIEDDYAAKGVRFVFVNPSDSEPKADMAKMAKSLGLNGPYLLDPKGEFRSAVGAKTTTEVFVLDRSRTLVYRGAVDDQYGIGASLDAPRNPYLREALDATLRGEAPALPATDAPGCLLPEVKSAATKVADTYHNRISRIMAQHCVECHRDGGVAPFRLDNYADVKSRAKMIDYVIEKGIMPPWFAKPESGPSPWKNDRSLVAADRDALKAWLAGPMPEGDPKDAPQPKTFDPQWKIGKPDAVVTIPKPFAVKAEGIMPYQNVIVPTGLTEDKWVSRLEVQPTARQVVHHVLIFVVPPSAQGAEFDPLEEVSGFFAAYVPGNNTLIYPDGFAKKLPAGSSLRFQIHYTPNGEATQDQTRLGLVFAKAKPEHEVHTAGITNFGLVIPPGAENHRAAASMSVPMDIKVMSLMPHMHVRGKACRYDLIRSDGSRSTMLDVPRYDFNWQLAYDYREPVTVEKGSKIEFAAWYDNSPNNPNNPDPKKTVRWGLQTYDEMHLGYLEYYVPGLAPGTPVNLRGVSFGDRRPAIDVDAAFKRYDKNGDGKVTADEMGMPALFRRLDLDGDGVVTLEEAKRALGG